MLQLGTRKSWQTKGQRLQLTGKTVFPPQPADNPLGYGARLCDEDWNVTETNTTARAADFAFYCRSDVVHMTQRSSRNVNATERGILYSACSVFVADKKKKKVGIFHN